MFFNVNILPNSTANCRITSPSSKQYLPCLLCMSFVSPSLLNMSQYIYLLNSLDHIHSIIPRSRVDISHAASTTSLDWERSLYFFSPSISPSHTPRPPI